MTKKPMKLPPRNAMVQLTDPDTGKARKMKPLGQAARRIYRKQILAGTDPAFVLPRELRWQPDGCGYGMEVAMLANTTGAASLVVRAEIGASVALVLVSVATSKKPLS